MTTSIAAARASLYSLIRAEFPDESEVLVTYGPPATLEPNRVIALLGVLDPVEEDVQLGGQRKEERYRLVVGIKVFSPDDTDQADGAQAVDAIGFDYADRIRGVVHGRGRNSDRSLDGALGASGIASVHSLETQGVLPVEGGGWAIFLTITVDCRARVP